MVSQNSTGWEATTAAPAPLSPHLPTLPAPSRRRGDVKTQTSDAKFDEKFQFAHGLRGKEAQPWYARPPPPQGAAPVGSGPSEAWLGREDPARMHRLGLDIKSDRAKVKRCLP